MSEILQRLPPVHTEHRHAQPAPLMKAPHPHIPGKIEHAIEGSSVPTPPTSVPGSAEPSLDKTHDSMKETAPQATAAPPPRSDTPTSSDPIHPNAKTTSYTNNGTTTSKTNISSPVCRNCKTQTTPLWRRDETGLVLCNACGLFLKLHGRPRPISLKTDTIKSRNRIKQTSNPSSKAGTSPNTPELKSRDGKSKKSPKSKKKNGDLTPLLPAHSAKAPITPSGAGASTPLSTTTASPFPQPTAYHTHHHHHMLSHLPHLPLPNPHHQHVVQPLHYPSSTPVQFAPSLQRITSPLLLLTTSSVRGDANDQASGASAGAAATVLEKMSSRDDTNIPGILLMSHLRKEIKREALPSQSIFLTPSSALNAQSQPQSSLSQNQQSSLNQSQPTALPPKLPALGSRVLSPAPGVSTEMSGKTPLPGVHSLPQVNSSYKASSGRSQENNQQGYQGQKGESNDKSKDNDAPNPPNPPNPSNSSTNEVTLLKTRISELELVNDLYRTRIMELEAMEQAARLREQSTRKRLDELLSTQDTYRPPISAPNHGVTLPPPVLHKSGNLLPSIRGGVVLPSLKRENDDEANEAAKKQRT